MSDTATPSTYTQTIFINLPVGDLTTSIEFYTALGFVQNQTFSDDKSAMISFPMDLSAPARAAHTSPIKVMLMSRPRFTDFLPEGRELANAKVIEVLLCLSMNSRDLVDDFLSKVEKAGGRVDVRKPQEYGWLYGRSFEDLDGHVWEMVWMDPKEYEGKE